MFNTFVYQPILQFLIFLQGITGSLGISIILLTLTIRLALLPLTIPSLKAAKKMRDLKPEIDSLKSKHKNDKTALQKAQLELFQKHQVNPASGCLPQIFQIIILIALYRVFIDFLGNGHESIQSTQFYWLDLAKPDNYYVLPVLAALTQLVLSFMISPGASTAAEKTLAAQTKTKKDDKAADDMSSMAESMQQQMLFIMPLMTGFIALRFPSGLALYWVIGNIISLIQQYLVSGLGGLSRVKFLLAPNKAKQ